MNRTSPVAAQRDLHSNTNSQSPIHEKLHTNITNTDINVTNSPGHGTNFNNNSTNSNNIAKFDSPSSLKSKLHLHDHRTKKSPHANMFSMGTSMILSFLTIFVLINTWNATRRTEYSSLRLVPNIAMYRSHRRLQAEAKAGLMLHPLKTLHLLDSHAYGIRVKEIQVCKDMEWDDVPCYNHTNTYHNYEGDKPRRNFNDIRRDCEHEVRRERVQCVFPTPDEYKVPLRWPASRDGVWHGNMKFIDGLSLSGSKILTRLTLQENGIVSLNTVESGLNDQNVQEIIHNLVGTQTELRTVLDINCGLHRMMMPGALSRHLEKASILCISPYEEYGSQVHFHLERGFPAVIGSFNSSQLPFPSFSFDMIHCFDCNFDWSWKEGLPLLELDRLLKYDGLFMWTSEVFSPLPHFVKSLEPSPLVNKDFARNICWSPLLENDAHMIWRKASNHSCYSLRTGKAKPKLCGRWADVNSSMLTIYPPLRPCISKSINVHKGNQARKDDAYNFGFSAKELLDDLNVWCTTVESYWSLLTPLIFSDHPKRHGEDDTSEPVHSIRNVMDMNALHGSLNAALLEAKKPVWVMNVVPQSAPDTLSTIYNRGLLGVRHNWCEAFPTYPRTYDLLHGIGLLSQEIGNCGISNLFLEMDRILRPEGWVMLRDKSELIEDMRILANQMRWETRVIEVDAIGDQQLLVCQKVGWRRHSSSS